jgi:RimJ/RimL family protein N-acetyltransferase
VDPHELIRTCRYQTARLVVAEWHGAPLAAGISLADVVATLLTSKTTRALPLSWRGDYDTDRAAAWVRERDKESVVLMVTERRAAAPVGLVILFSASDQDGSDRVDIRLGYLLGESAWGKGLATELVSGLVEWCRSVPRIRSIAGGVGLDNLASARVLVKSGFEPVGSTVDGEQLFELDLSTGSEPMAND